jgi:hypothetical protein
VETSAIPKKKKEKQSFAGVTTSNISDPATLKEALSRPDKHMWEEAINEDQLRKSNLLDAKGVTNPLDVSQKLEEIKGSELNESNFPYREAVGGLIYLMNCTRPDIAAAVGVVSRFLSHPERQHWNAV